MKWKLHNLIEIELTLEIGNSELCRVSVLQVALNHLTSNP
jgi:hypothetical protein